MDNDELLLAISNLVDAKLEAYTKQVTAEIQNARADLGAEIQNVRADLGKEIRDIKVFQENVILPRLQNIEASYLSTYARYRDGADRMEAAYADISLVKNVVQKHSEELQEQRKRIQELDEKLQKLA